MQKKLRIAKKSLKQKVTVAVVRAGRMATIHAENLSRHDDALVSVVVDPDHDAATALARKVQSDIEPTLEGALERRNVEAVVIASPTQTHAPYIELCVTLGIPVFCEKPIDLSLDRVDACLSVVADHSTPVLIGFHRRFDEARVEVWKIVQSGSLGSIEHISQISRDPRLPPRSFLQHSGRLIRDMVIHDLDELVWLLGNRPVTVYAELRRYVDEDLAAIEDYDTAAITVSIDDGPQCHISASRRAVYGFDQRIEVFGSAGMVQCLNPSISIIERADDKGFQRGRLLEHFPVRYANAYRSEMNHFVDIVRGRAKPLCTAWDARKSLALAEAVIQSHNSGTPIRVLSLSHGDAN
jgi:myo-inositol 2-dehydrogenase/D-chiro-inositol 1-dehydrogenase